jgi:hypothetical protein
VATPAARTSAVDIQGRPYFLWWTDVTLGEFVERLEDPDPDRRAYWLGALLREAHTRDVWSFTTPETVRALWPRLVRHLGRTRAMWAWLLEIESASPESRPWPPSTGA